MIKVHQRKPSALDTIFFFKGTKIKGGRVAPYIFEESELVFSLENNADTLVEFEEVTEIDAFLSSEEFTSLADSRKKIDSNLILVEFTLEDSNLTIEILSPDSEYVEALKKSAVIKYEEKRSLNIKVSESKVEPIIFRSLKNIQYDWVKVSLSKDLINHKTNQPIDVDRFSAIQNTFLTIPPMLSGALSGIR